jgi:hypothetical protein
MSVLYETRKATNVGPAQRAVPSTALDTNNSINIEEALIQLQIFDVKIVLSVSRKIAGPGNGGGDGGDGGDGSDGGDGGDGGNGGHGRNTTGGADTPGGNITSTDVRVSATRGFHDISTVSERTRFIDLFGVLTEQ